MKKAARGFSLIEMILVGALVAVLGVSVYGTLSQGIRLWRYVMNARPHIELDLFIDRLTLDARNAFMDSNKPFSGDRNHLRFFSMAVPSSDEVSRKMFGKFLRPVMVVYAYDRERHQIVKIRQEYQGLLSVRKKNPPEKKIILEHVRDAAFSFYRGRDRQGGQVWKKKWDENERCLPRGIRITVQLDEILGTRRADQVINLFTGFCREG